MRTPPGDLAESEVSRAVTEGWGFPVLDLRHAPVGFGSHHWVATDTAGSRRFVTVDDLDQHGTPATAAERLRRALHTAHLLRDAAGLTFVVAPVPAVDATLLRPVGRHYAMAVYPYVPHDPGPVPAPDVVELLARLHAGTSAVRTVTGVDDLVLPGRAALEAALAGLRAPWAGGPFAEPARELLAAHARQLRALLEEQDRLAARTRAGGVPLVVTHGEPKAGNVLGTDAGTVLVDWDTALLAPAARDLWWVDTGDGAVESYVERTGRHVAPGDLAFYRLRWDLADVADFVRWLSGPHALGADTELAWESLSGIVGSLSRSGGGGSRATPGPAA